MEIVTIVFMYHLPCGLCFNISEQLSDLYSLLEEAGLCKMPIL